MFIVIEIQANENNEVATIVTQHNDRNQADSKYHTVLAAASVSSVHIHSAVILTADGQFIDSKTYVH